MIENEQLVVLQDDADRMVLGSDEEEVGQAEKVDAAFVVGSPKGDLGHLGDLLPKRGLLKVTFLFKSLLSERKDYGDVLYTSFAAHEA